MHQEMTIYKPIDDNLISTIDRWLLISPGDAAYLMRSLFFTDDKPSMYFVVSVTRRVTRGIMQLTYYLKQECYQPSLCHLYIVREHGKLWEKSNQGLEVIATLSIRQEYLPQESFPYEEVVVDVDNNRDETKLLQSYKWDIVDVGNNRVETKLLNKAKK